MEVYKARFRSKQRCKAEQTGRRKFDKERPKYQIVVGPEHGNFFADARPILASK